MDRLEPCGYHAWPQRTLTRGGALSGSAFVSLIYNAALLLVLAFLYDLIARYFRRYSLAFKLLTGLVLGLISIAVMVAAWRMPNGVIFDTRSVVLSMGTLFYGTIPGMIAGAIAAVYRASQGGSGVVMGVSVIAMSVVVGAVWRRWRRVAKRDPSVLEIYLFGLTVHACMLLLTFTLPSPLTTLRDIALPVIVIYPLAAVLLGLLMIDQRRRRRSVTTLRESEERYRSLFEDSPVAMWEEDDSAVKEYLEALVAEGVDDMTAYLLARPEEYARCVALTRTLDANKAAVRLFEAESREELIARNSDLYRRESDRGIYLFWAAMLAGERSATFEEADLSLRGKELHVLETCTVVPGHEATFDRVYIADVDISGRKQAEEDLARSYDLLAKLARLVPGVVYQYRLYPDGRSAFPYASPGMNDIYEVTPEEVREDATPVFGRLHPDDYDRVSDAITESARTLETFYCEFRVVLPRQGLRWRWSQAHPERMEDGGTLWHGIISDITERKQAEEALQASQQVLEGIINAIPVRVFWKDKDLVYLGCNAIFARDAGFADPKDIIGKDDYQMGWRDQAERYRGKDRQIIESGSSESLIEEPQTTPEGDTITLLTSKMPLRDSAGEISGVLGTYMDITARKLAEEEIRRQAEQLRHTVEGAVLAMSQVVETRDPYTAGHERRVSELATAIARDMGMDGEELTALRLGALIHDIGKIGVPAEILSRPGRLSEVEFSLIQQHPATGFDILGAIDFGLPVAEMVLQHHERLDGSGYPRGLTGEEILPEARILAVADVVEAMSSHRPYRPALGMEAALTEVREHTGVKYDAAVVATCMRLVEEQGFQFTP